MEIGFTSWFFEESSDEQVFAFAAENGLSGIQWDNVSGDVAQMRRLMERYPQVRVHCLGRFQNYLVGSAEERAQMAKQLRGDIEVAAKLGIEVVELEAGRDPWKTVEENIPLFMETFGPAVELAEELGVKLAMENRPQPQYWPAWGNLANTVENMRRLFEAIPSPALGLAFDPSHFVWLGIDYIAAVHEFGERIYAAHAKDTEIMEGVLAEVGYFGKGWWRYRLPGWGEVDWVAFLTALREVGYTGSVCIEHEDALWLGNLDELKQGTLMAARYLGQFDL